MAVLVKQPLLEGLGYHPKGRADQGEDHLNKNRARSPCSNPFWVLIPTVTALFVITCPAPGSPAALPHLEFSLPTGVTGCVRALSERPGGSGRRREFPRLLAHTAAGQDLNPWLLVFPPYRGAPRVF